MKYITPKEAAEKWGISQRRVHTLCLDGRVEGAERHGWTWLIPETAEKPADARVKSGRYIKTSSQALTAVTEAAAAAPMPQPETKEYRFHIPVPPNNAVLRPRLLDKIAQPGMRLTYIHADAGYGKTTLLAQYAHGRSDVLWLAMEEKDSDVFVFLQRIEKAAREILPQFDFHTTDFIPHAGKDTFIPAAVSALLQGFGTQKLTVILDDTHVLTGETVTTLLTEWVKRCPPNLTLIMASRHELWSGLLRMKLEGGIAVLTKTDLRFNREETESLWGFFDKAAYMATEGWALAVQTYRIAAIGNPGFPLLKLHADIDIYHYLMDEIFKKLPPEEQRFLLGTSMLSRLEVDMCDSLLGIKNSHRILESLVRRNLFTTRVSGSEYHYHPLFRAFLQQNDDGSGLETARKAMAYCYDKGDYEQTGYYAILTGNAGALGSYIDNNADSLFAAGRYTSIKGYFDFLEAQHIKLTPRTLLAKGMYLSSRGSFFEADKALSAAMPCVGGRESILYLHAMTHQARILRNKASFEESSRCLDSLLPLLEGKPMVVWYTVMIEKIYNLTMTTQLDAAMELLRTMIGKCSVCGDLRVKAWFERYLTAVYFFTGDYANALKAYEKSLSIRSEEQEWLMRHSVGCYAAMACLAAGEEEKAVSLMESELEKLHRLELYEELCLFYLFYALILHALERAKVFRREAADYSVLNRYLDLAEEYATFNRSNGDYLAPAKLVRMCTAPPEQAGERSVEILNLAGQAVPFFRSMAYYRLAEALHSTTSDIAKARQYYAQCIATGEQAESFNYVLPAYGGTAAICLQEGDETAAAEYARKFMELSDKAGNRFCFRLTPLFAPVLEFTADQGITPEFTCEMLSYGGYKVRRIYINTLGGFYIASEHDRKKPVKIRTQKARELLAYLLEKPEGIAREKICADLWERSDANVTNLFHIRRSEIKSAFASLGAGNPILYENGVYRLCRDELSCDLDAFQEAADAFVKNGSREQAQKVVELYTGRYLDDMEAPWAEGTRLYCEDTFIRAVETLLEAYIKSGERVKTTELLRRCAGMSRQGYWRRLLEQKEEGT